MVSNVSHFYPFSYNPLIECPHCNQLFSCVDLDNKSIIIEHDDDILCPYCAERISNTEIRLIKNYHCNKCNNDFPENSLINLHANNQFECPDCSCVGRISLPFKEFKYRFKDGEIIVTCPYKECNISYPESELIPNNNGAIAKCPICKRFAEIPVRI